MTKIKDKGLPAQAGKETMEIVEDARQKEWAGKSFVRNLFLGDFSADLIYPFPTQDKEDKNFGDKYLEVMEEFLRGNLDADEVDRTGELPQEVIKGLIRLNCFKLKIPKEYGGIGISQFNYGRVKEMIASHCASTAIWVSAHQSIGVPNPLKLFGTEEQKKKYLTRLAHEGLISGFALTEPGVGSDPASMTTTATLTEDGKHYLINGEKLWCSNGNVADVLIVVARTPDKIVNGKAKKQITCFIVETKTPGFEVAYRCDFLGCRGIINGILRFKDVKVPAENILSNPGDGLKIALTTLNTGRLTLAGGCIGAAKQCLNIARRGATERVQWGGPIGKHDAIAGKLAEMAAYVFAMESVWEYSSLLADSTNRDFRLEAAITKLFCSEATWKIADEALQIRGGRGYEKAQSLRGRGEKAYPIERILREVRINRIIEGTSEIMHLFIAREALDFHMKTLVPIADPAASVGLKTKAALAAAVKYAIWYPKLYRPARPFKDYGFVSGKMSAHMRFVEKTGKRLARMIFRLMLRYQQGLEKKQQLISRVVDIGVELFAMAATCSRAETMLVIKRRNYEKSVELADLFCKGARKRIERSFEDIAENNDRQSYKVAQGVLEGEYYFLEDGIVKNEGK